MSPTRALILWADETSPNLGVRALATGVESLLRRVRPDAATTFHNYGHGAAPLRLGQATEVAREAVTRRAGLGEWLSEFDVVLDTRAGDSFADIYGWDRLAGQCAAAEFAHRRGVPVVLTPQTIGPFGSWRSRAVAIRSLRTASGVLARDSVSAAVAARYGRPVDALATDVVFAVPLPSAPARSRDVILNISGLLWSPGPHIEAPAYRAILAELYARLVAEGRNVTLLAHVLDSDGPDNDVPAVREFTRRYAPDAEVVVPQGLEEVRAVLAQARLVIGSRMHACLNALSVGTPAIPLAYSRKFAPLLADLDWPHVVDLRSAGSDAPSLVMRALSLADLDDRVEVVRQRAAAGLTVAEEVLHEVIEARGVRSRGVIDGGVSRVVADDNCSGCGACTLLDPGLEMFQSTDGYLRPKRRSGTRPVPGVAGSFVRMCPGRAVMAGTGGVPTLVPPERSATSPSAVRHPYLGPVRGAWQAWAADPDLRHRGSSGGALTALTRWLIQSGEVPQVASARMDERDPRRTRAETIRSSVDAFAAAGSRYAPVAVAANQALTLANTGACVGKPCEVSALRGLRDYGVLGDDDLVLLSFFCAGTPSQLATDALVRQLGVPAESPLLDLWYRGRGWPGRFTAVSSSGTVDALYDESWGKHLGPTIQWRCKICPDGVGESADVVAADLWTVDSRGYPDFAEQDGRSALLARTERGYDMVRRAIAAGVIVAEGIDPDSLARVQPFQTARRGTLLGRLVGASVAGRRIPSYRGFGLTRLASAQPREAYRMAKGSFARVRAARRHAAT